MTKAACRPKRSGAATRASPQAVKSGPALFILLGGVVTLFFLGSVATLLYFLFVGLSRKPVEKPPEGRKIFVTPAGVASALLGARVE